MEQLLHFLEPIQFGTRLLQQVLRICTRVLNVDTRKDLYIIVRFFPDGVIQFAGDVLLNSESALLTTS